MGWIYAADHVVLTVRDPEISLLFYERLFGEDRVVFGDGRTAISVGAYRIHFHTPEKEILPRAAKPTPGSADLCFLTESLEGFTAHAKEIGITPFLGPVHRNGAAGPLLSLYFRDPDGNLIEVAEPLGSTVKSFPV